jgi:hypothetical protein
MICRATVQRTCMYRFIYHTSTCTVHVQEVISCQLRKYEGTKVRKYESTKVPSKVLSYEGIMGKLRVLLS